MKQIIYILGFIALGAIVSCERDTETLSLTENANQEKIELAGEWSVVAYNDTTVLSDPFKLITLKNSTSGNDSITIQDTEVKFWKFQVKAKVDEANGSFETKLSTCEVSEDGVGVKISNGQILNNDSIFLNIQFEDDETPYGTIYQLKGHRISK